MKIALFQARTGIDPAANADELVRRVTRGRGRRRGDAVHAGDERPARPRPGAGGGASARRGGRSGARRGARGGGGGGHLGPSRLARPARRARRQARQSRLRDRRRRARSAPATTRSTCSTSICRPARAGANRPPIAAATAPSWSTRRVGRARPFDLLRSALRRPLFGAQQLRRDRCFSIPAAFTVPTGEAHWHVLMRARAIEAGAFVVAAAQVGPPRGRPRRPTAIRWSSIPGARCCSTWAARSRVWASPRSTSTAVDEVRARLPAIWHRRPIPPPEHVRQ